MGPEQDCSFLVSQALTACCTLRTRMGGVLSRQTRSSDKRERKRVRALRRPVLRWGDLAILVVEILPTKTRAEIVAPMAPLLLLRFPTPSALARGTPRTGYGSSSRPASKRSRQLIACATASTVHTIFWGLTTRSLPRKRKGFYLDRARFRHGLLCARPSLSELLGKLAARSCAYEGGESRR